MKQDYFVYNGIKILSGTVIAFKNRNVIFLAYSTDDKNCFFGNMDRYCIESYPIEKFESCIDCITNEKDNRYQDWCDKRCANVKHNNNFTDELNNDSLFLAWIWYIFIMAISIIFNGFWLIWIVASYIFFDYRKEKLRKAGYKQ